MAVFDSSWKSNGHAIDPKLLTTETLFRMLPPPPVQLDSSNQKLLKTYRYMVGPKADGERAILYYQSAARSFHLFKQSSTSPLPVEGSYSGKENRDFLLDTEVITLPSGSSLILLFDICTVNWDVLEFFSADRSLRYSANIARSRSEVEDFTRRNELNKIMKSILAPNIHLKPIAPAQQAELMWDIWQELPYPIDGLVFTRVEGGEYSQPIKWKPKEEMTIDIALGEPISTCQEYFYFRALLPDEDLSQGFHRNIRCANDILPSLGYSPICYIPGKQLPANEHPGSSLPHENHQMKTDLSLPLPQFRSVVEEVEGGDIWHSEIMDIIAIQFERIKESFHWHRPLARCSNKECPCQEDGSGIMHCAKCGALGCGDESFSCVLCQGFFDSEGANSSYLANQGTVPIVRVPKNIGELATNVIVEVELDCIENGAEDQMIELRFKRIRHDKKRANSVHVANDILREFLEPTLLSNITFKEQDSILPVITDYYRLPESNHRSNFSNMRKVHYQIKGWLYETYGGCSIIDACAGRLHDIYNWKRANISSVLAIEKDIRLFKEGLGRLEDKHKRNSAFASIDFIHGDVSTPLDLSSLNTTVDAIFCNFALHYVWRSPEETLAFLANFVPHLSEGGRFVVTLLDGDKLFKKGSFMAHSNEDVLEFEAKILNKHTVNIYIETIGVAHDESIIYRSDLVERFSSGGLELVSWLPFDTLRKLFSDSDLSSEEVKMSSMYAAAVFEKKEKSPTSANKGSIKTGVLISDILPAHVETKIMDYFSIPDLLKSRTLSQEWRYEIDIAYKINMSIKETYFGQGLQWHGKSVSLTLNGFQYKSRLKTVDISPRAVALYIHMGGPTPTIAESDVDSDDSGEDGRCGRYYGYDSC